MSVYIYATVFSTFGLVDVQSFLRSVILFVRWVSFDVLSFAVQSFNVLSFVVQLVNLICFQTNLDLPQYCTIYVCTLVFYF
jgi:hypothetical protein